MGSHNADVQFFLSVKVIRGRVCQGTKATLSSYITLFCFQLSYRLLLALTHKQMEVTTYGLN